MHCTVRETLPTHHHQSHALRRQIVKPKILKLLNNFHSALLFNLLFDDVIEFRKLNRKAVSIELCYGSEISALTC